MAELNPVSDTHALLESMLQKLRLNAGPVTDMQTCSPSGECNTLGDSSNTTVYQFGISSNSKEPDGRTSSWNTWKNPWTNQSSHFEDALRLHPQNETIAKHPAKRISKNKAGFSGKPKRSPLFWGGNKNFTSGDVTSWVADDQMPEPKKKPFSLDRETSSNLLTSYKTEAFQNPPDLLAPTLTTTSTVLDKSEVRGQIGTWSWGSGIERNDSTRLQEQSGKTTKTSRRGWGEAKRWAQNVKERWREKHRSTLTTQREDGAGQAQSEVQSNHSSSSMPIDVNETPTALIETTDIRHEEISTALDEDGPGSLSLLSFGTTSDLMEEIFSGTEWAQFLSVNSTKIHQPIELANTTNQSREEELHSEWTHEDTTNTHLTQPSFAQDMAYDKQTETPQMSVTDFPTSPLQINLFTNQPQITNLNPYRFHNSEQSQFSQLDPNESKPTAHTDPQPMSSQVSDPSHNQPQDGTGDFIPVLDLSYAKTMKRSSVTSHGSLSRKREHWTNRRESFEMHTTQEMEHEENTQLSSNPSPASSLDSLNSVSQDSETSETSGTAVKKRRMEETRRVRFAEEVIILPTTYLSDFDDDEEEEQNEDNNYQELPSPRHSFPKWIGSLKPKSGKYKF